MQSLLLILALACFAMAALNVQAGKVNLLAVGLALWVAAQLVVGPLLR